MEQQPEPSCCVALAIFLDLKKKKKKKKKKCIKMHNSISIRSAILMLPKSNSVIARKNTIFNPSSSSFLPHLRLKNPCKAALLRLTPTGSSVSDSFDEAHNNIGSYVAEEDDQELVDATELKEVEELMKRLESMKERFVSAFKMEKCLSKMKGEISGEKKRCVEMMSKDIFDKIWEKPIKYLRSGEGNFEDRAKDFRVVLGIFEERIEMEKCTFH